MRYGYAEGQIVV